MVPDQDVGHGKAWYSFGARRPRTHVGFMASLSLVRQDPRPGDEGQADEPWLERHMASSHKRINDCPCCRGGHQTVTKMGRVSLCLIFVI